MLVYQRNNDYAVFAYWIKVINGGTLLDADKNSNATRAAIKIMSQVDLG